MAVETTQEDIQLLYKYLSKLYDSKKAEQLLLQHKNNLWGSGGLAMAVGKRSIPFFCLYYLQDTFRVKENNTARELDNMHYEIWDELEDMFISDTHDKEIFILPRGASKTTTIDMALTVWSHCYSISKYTVIMGKREKDAFNFIEDTKMALQNKYIEETFGKLINNRKRTVNKEEIELENDTKIQAFSSGTSVRGTYYASATGRYRPSLYILDDIISREDIITEGAKEKVIDKYYNEIEKGGDEAVYRNGKKIRMATKFIILGTPLSPDDFINTIRRDINFKVFHRSVVDFDIDDYIDNNKYWQTFKDILFNDKLEDSKDEAIKYYYDNVDKMEFDTIWNDKYQCHNLVMDYFNNRASFMQEMMCDTENIGERWFKSNRVQSIEEIESNIFTNTILCVDPAGIKNVNKSRADNFAFVVGSLADNNFKYVRKGEILKFDEFNEYINHVLDLLREFEDIQELHVEKNSYMGLDVDRIKQEIAKDTGLVNRDIEIVNKHENKNKDDRISTIVDEVNNGRIIFCNERVMKEALHEVMEFSGQATSHKDDFVDALAEFSNQVVKVKSKPGKIQFLNVRF
ncbi:MAG: terminase [Bacilli bacterium]|nr:terminase [Bacilli bacterium]